MAKERNKKVLLNEYYHIDNGGYTFKLEAEDNGEGRYCPTGLQIGHSFYDYVSSEITLHHLTTKNGISILNELGTQLIVAARKLEELNKK